MEVDCIMSESRKNQVKGVGCDVKNCQYHAGPGDDRCTAEHIDVLNRSATTMSETYCGAFIPKAVF